MRFHTRLSQSSGFIPVSPIERHQSQPDEIMKSKQIQLMLALLASVSATAQEPEGPAGHRPPPPVPPLFAAIDADHDGIISAAEIQGASDALKGLDQNGDGTITRDELRPPRPAGENATEGDVPKGPPPGKFPPPPVIAALDTDKDGTISAEELTNAPESLKQLDKDDDGALSPQELRPQGPPPPPREDGGDHPQGPPPEEDDGAPM